MAVKSYRWSKILQYPIDFHSVPCEEINSVGPKGLKEILEKTPLKFFVDDFICGIDIKESACIHDACWYLNIGKSLSDDMFFSNMMIQIANAHGFFRRQRAKAVAYCFYWAVKYGGDQFYKGKK